MKRVLLTGLAILPILLVANPTHASGGSPWGYTLNLGFSFGVSPGYQFGHGYGSGFGYGYAGPPNFGGAAAYHNGPLYNYGYGPYNQAMLGAGYPYPLGGAEAFYNGNGFGHGYGNGLGGCADGQCLPSFPRLFHHGHGLFGRVRGLFHHKRGCGHHDLPVGTTTFGGVPVAGGEVIGGCSGCSNGAVISSSQYTPTVPASPTPTATPYVNPLVMPLAPAAHQFPAAQHSSGQAGFSFGR